MTRLSCIDESLEPILIVRAGEKTRTNSVRHTLKELNHEELSRFVNINDCTFLPRLFVSAAEITRFQVLQDTMEEDLELGAGKARTRMLFPQG